MTSLSVRVKAAFLTLVFLLNTMVGLACSFGLNMGFNKDHHGKPTGQNIAKAHSHPPGTKKHGHGAKGAGHAKHGHEHNPRDEKGGCCKDEVAKFVAVDKQLNKALAIKAPLLFSGTYFRPFVFANEALASVHTPSKRFFVRCHHPPIHDIRIAVQSFQI